MKTLVLGAGNLLLSDEGFGVHFIRYLEHNYALPPEVQLLDAGTLGLMTLREVEEADRVFIIDTVSAKGRPGDLLRYRKKDFVSKSIPLKLSPHQAGIAEMLLVSEMRGRCPEDVCLWGIIPRSIEPGTHLSPELLCRLPQLAQELALEVGGA